MTDTQAPRGLDNRIPPPLVFLVVAEAMGTDAAWLPPSGLGGPVVFVLYITRFQIQPEEHTMQARFGESYAAYRARVRRWL